MFETRESMQLSAIVKNPRMIDEMDDASLDFAIHDCLKELNRLRMGGRSTSLQMLVVLLWNTPRRKIQLAIEACLALAFRLAGDPSFAQPEWGIVLAGVLIARYMGGCLPTGTETEIASQCKLLLAYFESTLGVSPAVQKAAAFLTECWVTGFPNGINPVLKACLAAWPETAATAGTSDSELKDQTNLMFATLPACMTEGDRRIFRLFLEKEGKWNILDMISLR